MGTRMLSQSAQQSCTLLSSCSECEWASDCVLEGWEVGGGGGQGSEFFQTILVSHEQPLLTMMLLCCAEPRSYYLRAPALLQPAGLHWQELLAASRCYTRDLVHCCILQRKQGYTFTCLELCLHSHSLTDVTLGVVSHIIRVTFVKHC